MPAAIGVKIAAPEKQTIVVCGDGAFQMTNNELSTMVEQGCDVKIVLLNNRTLGMVCELQRIAKRHKFAVALPDTPDFGKLADAFGVKSRRISQDADMADAIAELYEDRDGCRIMGEKARKIAEEQFDRPESYKKIIELIEELT